MVITEHEFLDDAARDVVVDLVEQHDDLALDRNPTVPGSFVTYGRATYLDVCLPRAVPDRDYFSAVAETNRALNAVFADFYENLRTTLEDLLAEPVGYEPELLALPGVHVFRGNTIQSAQEAGAHFDLQYQRLPLPTPPDAGAPPVSVTILLKSPANGTGLNVYDVTYADYERAYRMGRISALDDLVRRRTFSYHPYTLGRLVLHRGLIVHSLASPGPISDDDERVTIQGHAIRCGGRWILYW